MTTDGVAAAVAAIHSQLTTPSPPGIPAITDSPGTSNSTYSDKFDSRLLWYEDHIVGSFLVLVGKLKSA